jgi:ABC-type phosphate transport system permease subunit
MIYLAILGIVLIVFYVVAPRVFHKVFHASLAILLLSYITLRIYQFISGRSRENGGIPEALEPSVYLMAVPIVILFLGIIMGVSIKWFQKRKNIKS